MRRQADFQKGGVFPAIFNQLWKTTLELRFPAPKLLVGEVCHHREPATHGIWVMLIAKTAA